MAESKREFAFERREVVTREDGRRVMRVTYEFLLDEAAAADRVLCSADAAKAADGEPRATLVPPRYPVYMDRFPHAAEKSLWSSEEVDLSSDRLHLVELMGSGDAERVYVCEVLIEIHKQFAFSEDLIQECVVQAQRMRVTIPEEEAWLTIQDANEVTHKITYQNILVALVPDEASRRAALRDVELSPALKAKQAWMRRFTNPAENTQAEIRVAATCCEAIFFMVSFAIIFAVKGNVRKFPGICFANDYISRDEMSHADQHAYHMRELVMPAMTKEERAAFVARAREIVESAVEAESVFADTLLPRPSALLGLSAESLRQYVRFVGDCVLAKFGIEPLFREANPFKFMTLVAMEGRDNFHEIGRETSEYQRGTAGAAPTDSIVIEEDDY